jgi:carbamoyltransferase
MTAILGVSAFGPDSAAALVRDGEIVAAAQEEWFSRRPHDAAFPSRAAIWCLHECGLPADGLDFVAFYEKPLGHLGRRLHTCLAFAPRGLKNWVQSLPAWLAEQLRQRRRIRAGVGNSRAPLLFVDRQESHAAGAFFPSPYDEAAVLTLDGAGAWTTVACGTGRGNRLELTHTLPFPHSIGLLSSAFAVYCGLPVDRGASELMGLAPFGRRIYRDLVTQRLLDVQPDGSFRLNMKFFEWCQGRLLPNRRFERLFGAPPRQPEAPLLQRHLDLAASLQVVIEEVLLRLGQDLRRRTGMSRLALGGEGARNSAANGRLLCEGPFDSVWIQPAAGPAGAALGAALFVWHQLLGQPREPDGRDVQRGSLLGPSFDTRTVLRTLGDAELPHRHFDDEGELLQHVALALAEGKVVGWFSDRMEFGPRALGARSILADPRSERLQAMLSRKLGRVQRSHPFAAAVLREYAHEWFDLRDDQDSPYRLLTAPVLQRHRRVLSDEEAVTMAGDPELARRLNVVRSTIPAVTHVDGSARIQTVDEVTNPRFYRLLQAFHRQTGCPVLLNTGLRIPGEPLVCAPEEAVRAFLTTELDLLVLEKVVVSRDELDLRQLATDKSAVTSR